MGDILKGTGLTPEQASRILSQGIKREAAAKGDVRAEDEIEQDIAKIGTATQRLRPTGKGGSPDTNIPYFEEMIKRREGKSVAEDTKPVAVEPKPKAKPSKKKFRLF